MAYTTIDKPTDYFNTVLYTGNGSTQSITGVGFQPDWIWIKCRADARDHKLTDVVRGVTKSLRANGNNAEATDSGGVTAFGSDGFSLGTTSGYNNNTETFVAWNWLAGGSASSNTDGSLTSSVSANTTAGFSVGTYTGNTTNNATVGHGLSSAPQMIMVKQRGTGGDNWQNYFNDGTERNGFLNLTNAFNTPAATQQWGDNEATSSVFYLGSDTATNIADSNVFYAFHSVKGYSKIGSYTGNGNADGTFVYTGFKPAFFIVKRINSTGNWFIFDNKRNEFNSLDKNLAANANAAEDSGSERVDFLSNGFKIRTSSATYGGGSGDTFIYMAFAEAPFVSSGGIPTTAR